jgi:hypothetical protein
MSNIARVESIDVLKQFRASLCKFAEAAMLALAEAGGDVQRTALWLKQDRRRYWQQELHKRTEKFLRAKLELERKRAYEKSPLGGKASCIDEKKAFAAAKRRLEEAEEKIQNVQRWIPRLEKEAFMYQGAAQGLNGDLEVKVPNALAWIDNMITALEAYMELTVPADTTTKAGEPELQSEGIRETPMARKNEEPAESTDSEAAGEKPDHVKPQEKA